jgi:hypothetical protein
MRLDVHMDDFLVHPVYLSISTFFIYDILYKKKMDSNNLVGAGITLAGVLVMLFIKYFM